MAVAWRCICSFNPDVDQSVQITGRSIKRRRIVTATGLMQQKRLGRCSTRLEIAGKINALKSIDSLPV